MEAQNTLSTPLNYPHPASDLLVDPPQPALYWRLQAAGQLLGTMVEDYFNGAIHHATLRGRKGTEEVYFAWRWDDGAGTACLTLQAARSELGHEPPVGCEDLAGQVRLGRVTERHEGAEIRKHDDGHLMCYFAWPATENPIAFECSTLREARERLGLGALYHPSAGSAKGEAKKLRAEADRKHSNRPKG